MSSTLSPACHALPSAEPERGEALVALAGNPNTGKTTLFNCLTGNRARVGNYPGITVERIVGSTRLPSGSVAQIMDVPGAYSLSARSQDEQVALRAVAGMLPGEEPAVCIVAIDATQLTRNLYLCLQIIELGTPVVVALTMVDLLQRRGRSLDVEALSAALGVPVVAVQASRGRGLGALLGAVEAVLAQPERGRPGPLWTPTDGALLEDIDAAGALVPEPWHGGDDRRRRALALWALLSIDEKDELEDLPDSLRRGVLARLESARSVGREIEREVIQGRYDWIDSHAASCLQETPDQGPSLSERLDRVLLHPALGFPVFLALMTLVFQSLFTWADPLIGWIESLVSLVGGGLGALLPAGILTELLVDGVIAGVGAVLVFLPQILLLFLFIGVLEDSGYMARVAFLMDRLMRSLGLHGRAFVPMLSGFACAVPAILATRTMERRRDRLLTMMVVPLMTCSARLPVYGLLIAALAPPEAENPLRQGLLMAAMYLFSTVVALVCAAVLGRTLLRGPRIPFLLEMPPYRLPHAPSVLRMMVQRGGVFVREAGSIILICTVVMWALLSFPRSPAGAPEFERQRVAAEQLPAGPARETALSAVDSEERGALLRESLGGRLGRAIEPLIAPLGFDWKVGIGVLGAFAAREVFVSTMAVVYGLEGEDGEGSASMRERIRAQTWPDGRRVFTPLVCFSLMVFFALSCQCMSTLAVVKRETRSWRWPVFLFTYMTVLAWVASFVVYQGGQLVGLS